MAFSLSPAVDVREYDLTANAPNLPSSRTGMVLRADTGPANLIVSITKESELINAFGKPTAENFQDWFQAWNFLQYAGSLYLVRSVPTTAKNMGLGFSWDTPPVTADVASFYNKNAAEVIINTPLATTREIDVYSRYISATTDTAVAICTKAADFNKPIARPFQATLSASAAVTAKTISASGVTLTVGQKVDIGANSYTVASVSATGFTISATGGLSASAAAGTLVTATTLFENMFDDSMIDRTGYGSTLNQTLINFNALLEYEPDWLNGEFMIVIMKKDAAGLYQIAEVKTPSFIKGKKDVQGRNNYAVDLYLNTSKYAYVVLGENAGSFASTLGTAELTLQEIPGGTVSVSGITKGDILSSYDLFGDAETFDVNILIPHELELNYSAQIAETRRDCVNIVAPMTQSEMQFLATHSNNESSDEMIKWYGTHADPTYISENKFNTFGTYSAIYGNAKYQYDKWNDVNRWISIAGDVAGLCAQNDSRRDAWWAIAGTDRGKIKNAIKLAFNPNKASRDNLYVNSINPVMNVPGEGLAVVWGQKTATAKNSAFDRLNVRRLMIQIEKTIATSSRTGLFEFNDSFTRSRLYGMIEPYLRSVKSRRGIYDYKLVIDETNNTPEVIDANGLVIDVYVKPTRVAEFIQVNAVVVKTGVSFSEVVGKF